MAVLTRASIRLRRAPRFWRFIEPTSRALAGAEGLRLAIGLGELPLVRQATFSLWDSAQAMQQYAYRDVRHREVIQLTPPRGLVFRRAIRPVSGAEKHRHGGRKAIELA
ncbi:MAG: hypothetical protein WKG07_17525 [Hymenobacter sp.]